MPSSWSSKVGGDSPSGAADCCSFSSVSGEDDEDGGGENERQASSLRPEAGGDTPDARSDAIPTWPSRAPPAGPGPTDRGAWLDDSGRLKWSVDNIDEVPIWKEKTPY